MNGFTRTTIRPGRSPWEATEKMYGGALSRWLQRQREMREEFGRAEAPLEEARALYAPGGAYGAGQRVIAKEQMQRGRAEALHRLVASGMASGSLVAGTQLAARRGLETAYRGIEDVRTERLTDALSRLSALRAGFGQMCGTAEEPSYAPAAGIYADIYRTDVGATAQMGRTTGISSTADKLAQLRQNIARQHTTTPRLSIVEPQTGGWGLPGIARKLTFS